MSTLDTIHSWKQSSHRMFVIEVMTFKNICLCFWLLNNNCFDIGSDVATINTQVQQFVFDWQMKSKMINSASEEKVLIWNAGL